MSAKSPSQGQPGAQKWRNNKRRFSKAQEDPLLPARPAVTPADRPSSGPQIRQPKGAPSSSTQPLSFQAANGGGSAKKRKHNGPSKPSTTQQVEKNRQNRHNSQNSQNNQNSQTGRRASNNQGNPANQSNPNARNTPSGQTNPSSQPHHHQHQNNQGARSKQKGWSKAGGQKRGHPADPPPKPAPREVLNQRVVADPPFQFVGQVGQGTYGKVYKAVDTVTQRVLAMKRLRLDSLREGLPVTAAREIKLLQLLRHNNIVCLNEIVVSRSDIYIAFDYIEHDLAGLLLNKSLSISAGNIKSVMQQTTAALAFLHSRMIMHRDIKGSNILVTADGVIKLADFGLARHVDTVRPDARYTNRVITLWYRPPELLLGADRYGPEVDEWGIGCLLAELFMRAPIFHGKDEISQLQAIYDILGVPSADEWPDRLALPWVPLFDALPMQDSPRPQTLAGALAATPVPVTPACAGLIASLLAMNPAQRLSAADALKHAYFTESPAAEPLSLKLVDEWHDWEAKQRTRSAGSADARAHSQPPRPAEQRDR